MARFDRAKAGRTLLRLIGRAEHRKGLRIDSGSEWNKILQLAAEHRLLPLLHARIERGEIEFEVPGDVRERLRLAHRESALLALAQRTELYTAVELLQREGLRPIALKGAWLAWYAYPAAAERPLRDIDLLFPQGEALAAFDLLRANGFRQNEPSPAPAEAMVGSAKHLPPLTSHAGVEFEIHMHAWEPPGVMEWEMPPLLDARILKNAMPGAPGDPCLYPKAQHMLMHLCIHAAYSHRFDVGPLLLADIDFLIHREAIDWKCFWRDAQDGGWHRGAAVVMRLYWMWMRTDIQVLSGCRELAPIDTVRAAEELLFQDPADRRSLGVAAAVLGSAQSGGIGHGLRRLRQRMAGEDRATVQPDGGKSENRANWFARRSRETLGSLADPNLRVAARRHAQIGRWLDEGEA